jgi:hypothetical protein
MEPKSEKPLRLFVNPFATWTDLALKTGQAMLATAQAAAARSNVAANVAVIPTADAPAPTARAEAPRDAEVAVLPAADAPRKARAPARQSSKAARFKATRGKLRSKTNAKRRTRR